VCVRACVCAHARVCVCCIACIGHVIHNFCYSFAFWPLTSIEKLLPRLLTSGRGYVLRNALLGDFVVV